MAAAVSLGGFGILLALAAGAGRIAVGTFVNPAGGVLLRLGRCCGPYSVLLVYYRQLYGRVSVVLPTSSAYSG